MSHAEKCPVCLGSGKYDGQACHGCDGRGRVTVEGSAEQQTIPYYVPPTEPINPWYPYWPPRITYYKDYESTGG
jgi:hypothetical protein